MPPLLRTDGLTKRYGHVLALDHLCLDVEEGEVVGFLGPNGAGKTTTIRLLLDLIRPTAGTASIGGFDCHRQSLDARRLVGYLPGEMPVYPEMTGRAYLAYLGRLAVAAPNPAIRRTACWPGSHSATPNSTARSGTCRTGRSGSSGSSRR